MQQIKQNGPEAWLLASRPKTLTGAAAPVLIGGAFAACSLSRNGGIFHWTAFLLCLLFAFLMQIDANLINDYFDFKKGSDREDRLGPERACASGWITLPAMKRGIVLVTVLSALVGLPLAFAAGWGMIPVGAACILFSFLYTTRLSYIGLGDLLVLIFFGIVPVGFTYFIQTGDWPLEITLAGLSIGLATDCLLIVNNHRDRFQDRESGKRTLAVRFGREFSIVTYYVLGFLAAGLMNHAILLAKGRMAYLLLVYLLFHFLSGRALQKREGKALNQVLGKTALNIFLLGILTFVEVVLLNFR